MTKYLYAVNRSYYTLKNNPNQIEKYEIEKETEKLFILKSGIYRHIRKSEMEAGRTFYFETEELAVRTLIDVLNSCRRTAIMTIEGEKEKIKDCEKLIKKWGGKVE